MQGQYYYTVYGTEEEVTYTVYHLQLDEDGAIITHSGCGPYLHDTNGKGHQMYGVVLRVNEYPTVCMISKLRLFVTLFSRIRYHVTDHDGVIIVDENGERLCNTIGETERQRRYDSYDALKMPLHYSLAELVTVSEKIMEYHDLITIDSLSTFHVIYGAFRFIRQEIKSRVPAIHTIEDVHSLAIQHIEELMPYTLKSRDINAQVELVTWKTILAMVE